MQQADWEFEILCTNKVAIYLKRDLLNRFELEHIVVGWAGESDEKFEHYITDETDHMYDFNCYEDYLEFNKSIFNEEDEDEIHYVMYEVFFPQYLLTCLYDYNMN